MPDVDEITQMLAGSYITYYHCKRIVELLKVSEADTRSFFGSYSSKRMNDWLEIVKLYETDLIYLGESSRILQHNVEYEIPSLKKKVAAATARIGDSHKKEAELRAKAQALKVKFETTCQGMGIEGGDDIRKELTRLPEQLPSELENVTAILQADDFRQAVAYYEVFVGFMLDGKDQGDDSQFKTLKHIFDNGNTSCYEFETGLPLPDDAAVNDGGQAAPADDGAAAAGANLGDHNGGIDFGDVEGGIDFGDSDGAIDFGGIDFGAGEASGGGKAGPEATVFEDAAEEIDFGDVGIDFGDLDAIEGSGIQVADFGVDVVEETTTGGDTEGPTPAQRETLLMNTASRNRILDQIIQIESFLLQRLDELSNEIDITSINQFEGAGKGVVQAKSAVQAMVEAVTRANDVIQSDALQRLFFIRGSEKFVDRMAVSLKQQKYQSQTVLGRIGKLEEQRAAAQAFIEEATPKIANLIMQTKVLKSNVEQSISSLYKGRRVNIIGGINSL